MLKELPVTPREILADLHHEVGHYPVEVQPWMRQALGSVPAYWNAAAAEQVQDALWYQAMRVQLCHYALAHLSSKDMRASMDQQLQGSVRQNLINLGRREGSVDA